MEGDLRFDSQWRPSPPYKVQLCGQLHCPTKCVKGRKRPVCAADPLHESSAEE
jgi:hypothetical protein